MKTNNNKNVYNICTESICIKVIKENNCEEKIILNLHTVVTFKRELNRELNEMK